MTLENIQCDYCRKMFIYYAFHYKKNRTDPALYKSLLMSELENVLSDMMMIDITFDATIWPIEEINKMDYRDDLLNDLLEFDPRESNYQNIVKLTYKLSKDIYDYRIIQIDLRNDYYELINSEVYEE